VSRLDGRAAEVACNVTGQPQAFTLAGEKRPVPVAAVLEHWREWIGALNGEPQRDVWQVETAHCGVCELHHLRHPSHHSDEDNGDQTGAWLLYRWED